MVFREHDNSWVRIVKHDAWLHLSRVILDYRYDQLLMSYINPDPAYWSVIAPLGMSKLNMLTENWFIPSTTTDSLLFTSDSQK